MNPGQYFKSGSHISQFFYNQFSLLTRSWCSCSDVSCCIIRLIDSEILQFATTISVPPTFPIRNTAVLNITSSLGGLHGNFHLGIGLWRKVWSRQLAFSNLCPWARWGVAHFNDKVLRATVTNAWSKIQVSKKLATSSWLLTYYKPCRHCGGEPHSQ